jgi:hypothetical protein
MNYDYWTISRETLFYDWLCYIARVYQSEKSKELISFLYTRIVYGILQRSAFKPWSLSCVMVDYSCRIPIYQPCSGKHSKESPTVTGGYYEVWHLSLYPCYTNTYRMICYYAGLNCLSLS